MKGKKSFRDKYNSKIHYSWGRERMRGWFFEVFYFVGFFYFFKGWEKVCMIETGNIIEIININMYIFDNNLKDIEQNAAQCRSWIILVIILILLQMLLLDYNYYLPFGSTNTYNNGVHGRHPILNNPKLPNMAFINLNLGLTTQPILNPQHNILLPLAPPHPRRTHLP